MSLFLLSILLLLLGSSTTTNADVLSDAAQLFANDPSSLAGIVERLREEKRKLEQERDMLQESLPPTLTKSASLERHTVPMGTFFDAYLPSTVCGVGQITGWQQNSNFYQGVTQPYGTYLSSTGYKFPQPILNSGANGGTSYFYMNFCFRRQQGSYSVVNMQKNGVTIATAGSIDTYQTAAQSSMSFCMFNIVQGAVNDAVTLYEKGTAGASGCRASGAPSCKLVTTFRYSKFNGFHIVSQ